MEKKKFWIIRNQIRDLLVDGLFTLTNVPGCGECVDACSLDLLYIENEKVKMTEERYCSQCEDCARVCAFRAITFK